MATSTMSFVVNARYNGQVHQLKISPHTTWEALKQQVTLFVFLNIHWRNRNVAENACLTEIIIFCSTGSNFLMEQAQP